MRKENKYRNIKTKSSDGIKFDSIAELTRYKELKLLEAAKEISELKLQVRYELQPSFKLEGKTVRGITYIADFQYNEGGHVVVEDLKSKITSKESTYKIKKKLLTYIFSREEKYNNYIFREVIK